MSKKAKTKNSLERKKQKHQRKAVNVAKFASYIGTPGNRKKKDGVTIGKKIPGHPHLTFCGNIGCPRCFPQFQ